MLDDRDLLLQQFVAKFEELDDLSFFPGMDETTAEFAVTEPDEIGMQTWRPRRQETDESALESLYAKLPSRLPPLFERLLLTYRWAEVHLDTFTLFANPPEADLSGWRREASRDKILWEFLLAAGYIPFAKGPDMDYDRVCFAVRDRHKNNESPIVKIDHEEILCNNRLRIVKQIAPSFRELLLQTIVAKAAP